MTAVFLDTVGLLALWDIADQWHVVAEQAFSKLQTQRATLVTSTFVLLECGNSAARRPYRGAPDDLRLVLERCGGLVTPTEDDWQEAWREYRQMSGNNAGIVDCVSFVVMRRIGIKDVLTNDRHFAAAGFVPLF